MCAKLSAAPGTQQALLTSAQPRDPLPHALEEGQARNSVGAAEPGVPALLSPSASPRLTSVIQHWRRNAVSVLKTPELPFAVPSSPGSPGSQPALLVSTWLRVLRQGVPGAARPPEPGQAVGGGGMRTPQGCRSSPVKPQRSISAHSPTCRAETPALQMGRHSNPRLKTPIHAITRPRLAQGAISATA